MSLEHETLEQAAARLVKFAINDGFTFRLHTYCDEMRKEIFARIRLDHPTESKRILPMHRNINGVYVLGEPKFGQGQKPIYCIDLIYARPSAVVFIVEGELVADTLNEFFERNGVALQYVATTSGGATSATLADWNPVTCRECVLFHDNDVPGRNYMLEVNTKLEEFSCRIRYIDCAELPEGGDFVDWLKLHPDASIEDLLVLITDANVLSLQPICLIKAITLSDFLKLELPQREYIIAPILAKSGLAMIYAYRGVGKTFVALEITMAVAYGGKFLNFDIPTPRKVLYIDGEMPASTIQERLAAIEKRMQPNSAMIEPLIITPDLQTEIMPNFSRVEGQELIEEFVEQADLIVIDNISTLCGSGRENEAESWLPIQQWALSLRKRGKSILFIHHAGKSGAQRGTSKREDILDTVIKLRHPADYEPDMGACFELHFEKARGIVGNDVKPLKCTLTDAGWVTEPLEISTYQQVVQLLKDGYKQCQIAKELGISPGQISKHAKTAKELGDYRG